jgi:hypothetical protein
MMHQATDRDFTAQNLIDTSTAPGLEATDEHQEL